MQHLAPWLKVQSIVVRPSYVIIIRMGKLHDSIKGITDNLSTSFQSISSHTHTVAEAAATPSTDLATLQAKAAQQS